jgi:hypothetical protein
MGMLARETAFGTMAEDLAAPRTHAIARESASLLSSQEPADAAAARLAVHGRT